MLSKYHISITQESLGAFFAPPSLRQIWEANVRQDSLRSFFGFEARRHVCDCTVTESLAYIDEEHAEIARLSNTPGTEARQRAALGRLLHTVQDMYAHTNYVALLLAENGVTHAEYSGASTMTGLGSLSDADTVILSHPQLKVAQWQSWRDPLYYVPGIGNLIRKIWLPVESHECINLDSPKCGAHFSLAMTLASHQSRSEYMRAVAGIREAGGRSALLRFHGIEVPVTQALAHRGMNLHLYREG